MKRKKTVDGISIQNFVSYYLGTKHNCSKLKHQGLKSFNNPYVVGVSNDFALKYPDCVVRQELVVVIDDYGNPGTYINPINIKKIIELEICKEKIKLLERISCYNFEEAALLYQIWIGIINDIKYLEGLYSGTYEMLYLVNKNKLLKSIRRYALEEAKRTLIFTKVKSDSSLEETTFTYDIELDNNDIVDNNEGIEIVTDEEYQVTEKVNRQKKLINIKQRRDK